VSVKERLVPQATDLRYIRGREEEEEEESHEGARSLHLQT